MTERNWAVFNGPNSDLDWFATKEEAEACINELIDEEIRESYNYGFSDECDEYYVLHVVGRAKLTPWKKREDQTIDEEGLDCDGDYWPDDCKQYSHLRYAADVQGEDGNGN